MISTNLPSPLKQVNSPEELPRIWTFRKNEYSKRYKEINEFRNDPFDDNAAIIYTEDANKNITSTGRLTFDSVSGLPENDVFPEAVNEYRTQGLNLVELGRFIITNSNMALLKAYYEAFYTVSMVNNVHFIMMVMRQKDVAFHQHMMGAELLSDDVGISFGSQHAFACVAWEIEKTSPRFFKWLGRQPLDKVALSEAA